MGNRALAACARILSLGFALALPQAMPAAADDPDPSVARLGFLAGDVSVQRADSGDTSAAALNAPLMAGDYLVARRDGRAEVQYDAENVVRIDADTQVRLMRLDAGNRTLQLAQGTVEVRILRDAPAGVEVQTPSVSVRPQTRGAYRISVLEDGSTFVTVRTGRADVTAGTNARALLPGSTLQVKGTDENVEFQNTETTALDDFDRWNEERDRVDDRAPRYASSGDEAGTADAAGTGDLDTYGHWTSAPGYGQVWAPYAVAGWAPYTDGRWVWEPYYGWTWVAAEPWGWAPYHYGRWFYHAPVGWVWFPGSERAPIWRPALVTFFSFGAGGLSLSFGNVGWTPLAPYEPLHPWWGRGGVAIVNNVEITRTYRNCNAPGGIVAVSGQNFIAGNFHARFTMSPSALRRVGVVQGALPIVPTRRNLQFSDRAAPAVVTPSARFGRFAQPAPAPRFAEQRRALQTLVAQPRVATPNGAWNRFGGSMRAGTAAAQQRAVPGYAVPAQRRPAAITRQAPAGRGLMRPSRSVPAKGNASGAR